MRLSVWEIALIVLGIIVLFGARKIPELMKGLGTGIKEFKKASNGDEENSIDTIEKDKNGE